VSRSRTRKAARQRRKTAREFTTKTAAYLHDRGRTVIFWGEYPLKPDDINSLPNYLVNGEVYGPQSDPVFRAHGIRQMIYTSTEGEEQLFPRYYLLPWSQRFHPGPTGGLLYGANLDRRRSELYLRSNQEVPAARVSKILLAAFFWSWLIALDSLRR
jgi:hypothetical protein